MHHQLFLRRTPKRRNTSDRFLYLYVTLYLLWFLILIQNYMIYLSKSKHWKTFAGQFLNIARTFLICLNLLGSSSGSALTSGKLRSAVASLCSSFQSALCTVTLTTLQYFNSKSQWLLHCTVQQLPIPMHWSNSTAPQSALCTVTLTTM